MEAWLHETRTLIIGTVAVVVFLSAGSELCYSPSISSWMHDLVLLAVLLSAQVSPSW